MSNLPASDPDSKMDTKRPKPPYVRNFAGRTLVDTSKTATEPDPLSSYVVLGNTSSCSSIQRKTSPQVLKQDAQSQAHITRNNMNQKASPLTLPTDVSDDLLLASSPSLHIPASTPIDANPELDLREIQAQRETLAALGFSIDEEAYFTQPPKKTNINELPDLLLAVQQDPRYKRLLFKYAPPKSGSSVLVQYAKNKVDPSHLPAFGLFVNSYRTVKLSQRNKTFKQMAKATNANDNLSKEAQRAIEVSLEAQLAKQGVKTGLEIAMTWIPVVNMIPLGRVVKIVGCKGIEKVIQTHNKASGLEGKALEDYKHTKAFLLYLGFPPMDDPLYSRWEKHRIYLKEFFGAKAEDDLYKMMAVWKQYKREGGRLKKTPKGVPSQQQAPMSMLLMMWHVYSCWDTPYYDQFVNLREKIKTSVFRYDEKLPQAERDKLKDQRLLGYDPYYEYNSHVELASMEHLESIVHVLVSQYQATSRFGFVTSHTANPVGAGRKLEHMLRVLVKHFIEKYQVWVYIEDDEGKTVRAAALWEPPLRRDPALPLTKMQRLKLTKTIGIEVNNMFFAEQEQTWKLRKQHYQHIESDTGNLLFFGYWHDDDTPAKYKFCLTVLLFDICQALPQYTPAYAQAPEDQSWDLREIGFTQMPNCTASNTAIHGFLYIKED